MRYVIRITTGDKIEYAKTPSRSAKVRAFRTPDINKADTFERHRASEFAINCGEMNPGSVVEFVEAPPKAAKGETL